MTGKKPPLIKFSIKLIFIFVGSPTKPNSFFTSQTAIEPSFAEIPTAFIPQAINSAVSILFTLPLKTISTTSKVCSSVYLKPLTNFDSIFNLFKRLFISGPPP